MDNQLQKKTEVGSAEPRILSVEPGHYECPRCHERQDKQLPHWCSHDHRAGLD